MSNEVKNLTMDLHDRIRNLAYLMWESAGRQHSMALQYWLNAEQEVLRTMQAATDVIAPVRTPREEASPQPTTLLPGNATNTPHGEEAATENVNDAVVQPAAPEARQPYETETIEKAETEESASKTPARKARTRRPSTRKKAAS